MIKIISGGQTGVDRSALDIAIELKLPHGGWCPKGRKAEDGIIPSKYELVETDSTEYAIRTEWNIRDSDATIIITVKNREAIQDGTRFTVEKVLELEKPYFIIYVDIPLDAEKISQWLYDHKIDTLNFAGPRESSVNGIYQQSCSIIKEILLAYQRKLASRARL
jgi:hypothetical protein